MRITDRTLRTFLFVLALALPALACAGTSGSDADGCQAALEREIDLRLDAEAGLAPELAEAHRQNLLGAGAAYVERCQSGWSAAQIQCRTQAGTIDALAACH